MKKKTKTIAKAVGVCVGAAAVSATMLAGCDWFNPFQQEIQGVYGPPPADVTVRPYDPANDEPVDVYGPPGDLEIYEPEEDVPAPVYGPPPEDYAPEDDLVECVYGPPEWFEPAPVPTPAEGENP